MTDSILGASSSLAIPPLSLQGKRVLSYLRRYWWFPLLTAVVGGGLAGLYAFQRPVTYTAAARMWVGGTLRIPEGSFFTEELQNLFGTQTELMRSEKIRKDALAAIAAAHPLAAGDEPPEVDVLQPRKTSLFFLNVSASDPAFAVDYLNAVMDNYLAYRREVRAASSEESLQSLTTELVSRADELRLAEEKLTAFQATNNAVVLEQEGVSAGNYLARLQLEFSQIKLECDLLGAIISGERPLAGLSPAISGGQGPSLSLTSPDAAARTRGWPGNAKDLDAARQYVELLKLERDDLAKDLQPKHPKMVKLKEEIVRSEKLIAVVQDQTLDQLRATHETLGRRVASLESSVRTWEGRVLDLNARMAEFSRLKNAVTRAQNLHDRFVDVIQGLDLNKRLDQVTVSILDRATLRPTSNRWKLWGAGGGALGFLASLALLGLLAARDDRLHSSEDLTSKSPIELLGQVPYVKPNKGQPLTPVEPDDDRFAFIESFRALRSAVLFMTPPENRPKTLLITSAQPGEGKSTVALNLARTLAFAGSKVLLVDGDLRRGALHEQIGTPASPGLADVVGGRVEAQQAFQSNGLPHLTFLSAGQNAANTGEIFLHRRFDQLILDSAKVHDFILIDSAPILATADTATLAPRVDAVLLVVRERVSHERPITQALELLTRRQANVVGFIFNGAVPRTKDGDFYGDDSYRGKKSEIRNSKSETNPKEREKRHETGILSLVWCYRRPPSPDPMGRVG